MSLNIGELVAYAKVDHAGVGKGIQAAQRDLRAGMDRLQRDAEAGGTKAGRAAGDGMSHSFKSSVASLGKGLIGAFAVERVVAGLRTMKDAASDLNETSSMSAVIFGKNADALQAWAEKGPQLLGLSTEATLRYSASLGDMLLQLGFAEDQTLATSQATLQMAADLGSFKNLETGDVLERINAGLRGEYDSLQLLIPNINAARVEKEALAETGKTVASSLTAEEKAAATLAIIQKDGARASGDFARTRNGEANASKTAAAEAQNLAAELGERLLPAYTAMVVFGRDQALPFLSSTIDYLDATADAAAPVAEGIGDVVDVFRAMPGPLQEATLGLIALVALRGRVEAFGTSVQTKVSGGVTAGTRALDSLRLSIMYASETAASRAGRFALVTKAIGSTAGTGMRGAASGLISVLGGPWGLAFAGAVTLLGAWLGKQKEAKDRVDALRDSLDKQTGAVTESSKATIVDTLLKDGTLQSAQSLGLALDDVTNAILGQTEARDRLNRQLALADQFTSSDPEAVEQQGNAILKVRRAIGGQSDELRVAKEQWELQNQAMGTATQAAGAAADSQKDLGEKTGATTKKAYDQAQALRDAAQATLDLVDAQLAAVDGEISYQKTLADGAQVVKDYGKKLPDNAKAFDLTTEAGQRAQEVLVGLARDTKSKTEQDAAAGASLKELRQQMQGSRSDFIDLATDLGLSKDAAERMATKFGFTKTAVDNVARAAEDLPAAKQIKIEADTAAAKESIDAVKLMLKSMKGRTLLVSVLGRFVMSKNPTTGGRAMVGGQTIDSADGNILRFAQGSEDHRAFIAQPGTPTRVFNEPETGGEAYIPLAQVKRPRSSAILSRVADEFGYDLVPRGSVRDARPTSQVSNTYVHNDIRTATFRADYSDVRDGQAEESRRRNLGGGL